MEEEEKKKTDESTAYEAGGTELQRLFGCWWAMSKEEKETPTAGKKKRNSLSQESQQWGTYICISWVILCMLASLVIISNMWISGNQEEP